MPMMKATLAPPRPASINSVPGLTISTLPDSKAWVPVAESMYLRSTARPYLLKTPLSWAIQSGAKAPPTDAYVARNGINSALRTLVFIEKTVMSTVMLSKLMVRQRIGYPPEKKYTQVY